MTRFFAHDAVARARQELGLTQEQAARALGVDVRTWRRYESGEVNDPARGFEVRNASRRKLLGRIAKEFGIEECDLLIERSEAPTEETRAEPSGHVLQPARHFVGREAELAGLAAHLANERVRVIAVVAPGGTGKTALVRELVRTTPPALVWSFYESPDADAFLTALKVPRGLVVLDGVEAVQSEGASGRARGEIESPALRRWLRRVADGQEPTRALVTSRFALVDLAAWEGTSVATLALGPLDARALRALFDRHGVRVRDATVTEALARTGGHALSLDVMGAFVGRFLDGDASRLGAFDADVAVEDDPQARRLARLLRAYAEKLPAADRDLLARLAAYPRGASIEALTGLAHAGETLAGALAGETRATLTRRLVRLADAGIVFAQRGSGRYAAHPFVRDVFRALGPERAVHDQARGEILASLTRRPGALSEDRAACDQLAELIEHTLGAGLTEEAASLYLRGLGGFAQLGMVRAEFAFLLRLLGAFSPERHPAALPPELTRATRLALTYDWALSATALGELGLAEAALRTHEEVAREAGAAGRLLVLARARAYLFRLAGRFDEALAEAHESIERAKGFESPEDEARGYALEGAILHARGDLDASLAAFARARELGDLPTARRGLWEAALRLERGELDTARALALAVRGDMIARKWRVHAAEADALAGEVSVAQGELLGAECHFERAHAVAEPSGDVELGVRVAALEHRLAKRSGDEGRALKALAAGRERIAAHRALGLTRLFAEKISG